MKQNLPTKFSVEFQKQIYLGETDLFYRIDIVLNDDQTGEVVAVLDTKYREPNNGTPKSSEVNQVLGYAKRMETDRSFLVYPVKLNNSFPLIMDDVEIDCLKFDLKGELEENGKDFLDNLSDALDRPDLRI